MNQIVFMIGDLPVRALDALIGFGALVLLLLLAIASNRTRQSAPNPTSASMVRIGQSPMTKMISFMACL